MIKQPMPILQVFVLFSTVSIIFSWRMFYPPVIVKYGSMKLDPKRFLPCAKECLVTSWCSCFSNAYVETNGHLHCHLYKDQQPSEGENFFSIVSLDATKKNLAGNKPVKQSSNYHIFKPEYAVDGDRICSSPNFTHTRFEDKYPWLQVDLGKEHTVQSVTIWNRQDCCRFRLHDFEIRVGNNKITDDYVTKVFDLNGLCGRHVGGGIQTDPCTMTCEPCSLTGRYVTIQITSFCSDCPEPNINVLHVCEVEVYGFEA
ncbi:uncharacterized protein LOC106468406 isoform X2 [Limulus polyphemus]|uniref:Uncharacterized protein LOC106468406 isoform X2 n=1 Tax=Limulus polyphemus TaxID=6850 RepID=A0ABM1BLB4_LIMPO|nr:uncharacterized protein LOC106468406 isoform X2 [Limulus polyphemus]